MPSEISQSNTGRGNELESREWGQEFILYDSNDPGEGWISINSDDAIHLDEHL